MNAAGELDPVEVHARALAAARPAGTRSAILAIECPSGSLRAHLYVSARPTPVWPHTCGVPGEGCRDCDPEIPDLAHAFDAMRPAAVALFTGLGFGHPYRLAYLVARDDWFERVPVPTTIRGSGGWVATPDRRNERLAIEMPHLGTASTREHLYAHAARNPDHAIDLRGSLAFAPTEYDAAALADVQAWTRAELGGGGADDRAIHLQAFAEWARARFAMVPHTRSALMCVSQFWNDNADDECHALGYVSERAVPLWPHPCTYRWEEDDSSPIVRNGEWCEACGEFEELGIVWGHAIEGLSPFSIEGANQSMEPEEAYRPFALARRVPDASGSEGGIGVEVEMIATCRRSLVLGALPAGPAWPDERARVLADAGGDGERAVLADHLIEVGDPRGEVIAHELAGASSARCDRATAAYRRGLVGPLGRVIALAGARFARGALAGADVFAATAEDADAVRGDPAWRTVETLRYLPGSHAILHPVFRDRLRALHGATEADAQVLVQAAGWAIETLAVAAGHASSSLTGLAAALPALRHLITDQAKPRELAALLAPWRGLASVTITEPADHLAALPAALAAIPQHVARRVAVAALDELGAPAGWRVSLDRATGRAEIALAGWIPSATRAALAAAVAAAKPHATAIDLVASPCFAPTAGDREELGLPATRTAP